MTGEMDRPVELKEPSVEPEVFVADGIRALGQEMARHSLVPLGQGKYLVSEEASDDEVARVLSKVEIDDPNLRNLNPREMPVDSAALALAKSYYLKEGIEDWKAKARLDKFADKIIEGSKKILSRPQLLKLATGATIVGLLATACGSVSAAPQARPLPPETAVTVVPTPVEPTKVPTPHSTETRKPPTPSPEVKAVSLPAEFKNADKATIAAWMQEGGTQLAYLSRGENLTGKLYYINGEGEIKEAPTYPSIVSKGEKRISMNKETGEINAFFIDVQNQKLIPVKLDKVSGDKWVDVKTGEFVWGNILGTVESSNPAVKELGTWNLSAGLPRGKLLRRPVNGYLFQDVFINRAVITGLYKMGFDSYELHYNFFNSDQKFQTFPTFKCMDCVVVLRGDVGGKADIPGAADQASLVELPPGTIIDFGVDFPGEDRGTSSPDKIEAKLKDNSNPPVSNVSGPNRQFYNIYSLDYLGKYPY